MDPEKKIGHHRAGEEAKGAVNGGAVGNVGGGCSARSSRVEVRCYGGRAVPYLLAAREKEVVGANVVVLEKRIAND